MVAVLSRVEHGRVALFERLVGLEGIGLGLSKVVLGPSTLPYPFPAPIGADPPPGSGGESCPSGGRYPWSSYGYSNPMGYQTSDFRLLWAITPNPQPPKPPMIGLCPTPPPISHLCFAPHIRVPPPPFLLPNSAPCFLCRP